MVNTSLLSGTATRRGWCSAARRCWRPSHSAYSVLLSALYLPLVLMLAGLIWRGVAFEFRFKADEAHRPFWDKAFAWGSYVAAFSQGVALGAFINGFERRRRAYAGGLFDWLTPFSLFTGFGLLVAYALLGGTWLIMKTEGPLRARMAALARPIASRSSWLIAVVSLWTPLAHRQLPPAGSRCPTSIFLRRCPCWSSATTVAPCKYAVIKDGHAGAFVLVARPLFSSATAGSLSACGRTSFRRLGRSGRRPAAAKHGVHAGRRAVHHPLHPRLHCVVLLRLPRQGRPGEGYHAWAAPTALQIQLRRVGWLICRSGP